MYKDLKHTQLREKIERRTLTPDMDLSTPQKGWIRLLREVYGMTTRALASRLGVSQNSVVQYERGEIEKRITLNVLTKVADALNCDLYYAFVPRQPVDDFLEETAVQKSKAIADEITGTMKLEDQAVSRKEAQEIYESILEEFRKTPRDIWVD